MTMTCIAVTGASGKAGRMVVRDLLEHGMKVRATDVAAGPDLGVPLLAADLTDYGQAIEVLEGVDAVVHLANIPAPGRHTPAETFASNTVMNFNVFHGATKMGLRRVVWASSETTLGLPFDEPPLYAPVDEDHYPHPTSTYALSKVASETVAEQISRWSGIPFVGLRFSNILGPDDYEHFPDYWKDPELRRWNLWGYIDGRDVGTACRLALEAQVEGASSYIIAAADTVMATPSADLLDAVYPDVERSRPVEGFETLLAIDRARSALGFEPAHSWRDHVAAPA
jgi:nucleoside-diphosphate-sugar epimerase